MAKVQPILQGNWSRIRLKIGMIPQSGMRAPSRVFYKMRIQGRCYTSEDLYGRFLNQDKSKEYWEGTKVLCERKPLTYYRI